MNAFPAQTTLTLCRQHCPLSRLGRPPMWRVRMSALIAAITLLGTGGTVLLRFAYPHSPALHAAIAGAGALFAAGVAALFVAQAHVSGKLRDLLVALGFAVLACGEIAFGVMPPLVAHGLTRLDEWGHALLTAAGLALLLGAALCPPADLRRRRVVARSALALTAIYVGAVSALAWVVGPITGAWTTLVRPIDSPHLHVHPAATLMEVLTALLAAWAATRFASRSVRGGDAVDRVVALALALIAGSRIGYLVAPGSLRAGPFPGEIGTMVAYGCVLIACVGRSQRRMVQRAVAAERRRIARNLHDGLTQELAFIASHSRRLEDAGPNAATAGHLRFAAERALLDSRTAIAVLTTPEDVPLDRAIQRSLEPLGARHGVTIEVEAHRRLAVDPNTKQELLRIANEATVNAIRHGGASSVRVDLDQTDDGARMSVRDDGDGFDVAVACEAELGLGLASMRERAELLGGMLSVDSSPGGGAHVEVTLP